MATQINIGKLVATSGVNGELILNHSLGQKSDLKGVEAIFVGNRAERLLPYFLQSAKVRTADESVVKLEGIDTVEQARTQLKQVVWLSDADFNRLAAKHAPIAMLGLTLIDGSTPIGEIVEVLEQPHQILCTVDHKGTEVLVPVHADNLVKMDLTAKKVYVDLPDGLLEVYLSP